MVERVDTVLRQDLGVTDGLADKNVYVLDPCCGTGSYLVEVLDPIHRTLKERGEDALLAHDVKEAARKRIFGFEILPAPFVVSHLQLGLLLQNLGVPLSGKSKERVGVYLTNALTGWVSSKTPKTKLPFPELEEERDAAEQVKREAPILVILGNPPYNGFAGRSPAEEKGLVEPYKEGLVTEWGIKKFNLDDLYVRFFRLAERRIVEGPQSRGIVCFISNFSYLSRDSYVVMRKRLLGGFNKLYFDCMNGDSRETGKLTPEGKPDPSVFSTKYNRAGIRVGTSIALMARTGTAGESPGTPSFRHFWGVTKNRDLLRSLHDASFTTPYRLAEPDRQNLYSFRPSNVAAHYSQWPALTDLAAQHPQNGLMEKRDGALIDIDKLELHNRMQRYYDADIDWEELQFNPSGITRDAARFNARKARVKVLNSESFEEDRLREYALRPFDQRWCYYSAVRPLWNEPRPSLFPQCWQGNAFLVSRPAGVASPEGIPMFYTTLLGDNDFLRGHAYYFPIRVKPAPLKKRSQNQHTLIAQDLSPTANLSTSAYLYLSKLGINNPDTNVEEARLIWMHALAIGFSPGYLRENSDGIRQNWPHIPLPDSREILLASAALGNQIAALLDTSANAEATRESSLKGIAIVSRVGGGELREKNEGNLKSELAVTAGWGHKGKNGVTMPGKGKILQRDYTSRERSSLAGVNNLLGDRTWDVYLNELAYWANVPLRVWEYTIGGYPVIKKWLSYREDKVLGRPLKVEEVRYVQEMARRIAAILLLEPALDSNYCNMKAHTFAWKG